MSLKFFKSVVALTLSCGFLTACNSGGDVMSGLAPTEDDMFVVPNPEPGNPFGPNDPEDEEETFEISNVVASRVQTTSTELPLHETIVLGASGPRVSGPGYPDSGSEDVGNSPIAESLLNAVVNSNLGTVRYRVAAYDDGSAEAAARRFNNPRDPFAIPSREISTSLVTLPKAGSATLTGTATVASVTRNGFNADNAAQYSIEEQSEDISLLADLANGTLSGNNDLLTVAGVINGKNLEGTVNHEGLDGTLEGFIANVRTTRRDFFGNILFQRNSTQALGYFAGSDSDQGKAFTGAFDVKD